ncbi:hypothetical protein GYH30_049273, partial [Glycine max]
KTDSIVFEDDVLLRRVSNIIPSHHDNHIGLPCDFNRSICGGKNELCYSQGPSYPDELESTRIIGERQFRKAVDLFNAADGEIGRGVDFRHAYIDFSQLEVTISDQGYSEVVKTCPAAMGLHLRLEQQMDLEFLIFSKKLVRDMLKTPSKEQTDCQCPKPILLDTGEMKKPYDWAPSILPIQILRIGQLIILSVPGEFTTMAKRHLRDIVKTVLTSEEYFEFDDIHIVIAGLTNTYSHDITTYEEYQVQRYEGASTLYGPHTLRAYIQEFKKIAEALVYGEPVEPGPQPPDLLEKQISLFPPVVVDATPLGVNFGDVCANVHRFTEDIDRCRIVNILRRSRDIDHLRMQCIYIGPSSLTVIE